MGARASLIGSLAVVLLLPTLLCAQGYNRYETQYGTAVPVPLDTVLEMPEQYEGRAVSTSGRLEIVMTTGARTFALQGLQGRAILVPVPETRDRFEEDALRWVGLSIEVKGVVNLGQDPQRQSRAVFLGIWAYLGPPPESKGPPPKSDDVTLEELLTRPGSRDGKMVRVVGQFRGANLYGDLPSASRRDSSDWVLKSDLFAAWVTGRKPRGDGFRLDPKLKRDTGKWLEVVGRVMTDRGVVYLEARAVKVGKAPSPKAEAKEAERPPPPPPKPPVIVFSLPLDGERDVAPNSVFKVQFSEDMDEKTFKEHVLLRYAGRARPGDRPLDAVSIEYDPGRRALTVDPGDLLRPGRVVELLFLPGIVDLDGLSLQARPERDPGGAADVLRYQVAPGFVANPSP